MKHLKIRINSFVEFNAIPAKHFWDLEANKVEFLFDVSDCRHKIYYVGFGKNERHDSLQRMWNYNTIYPKNGYEIYHVIFCCSDYTDQRKIENDRMSEL